MPPTRKPLTVQVAAEVRDGLEDAARRTGRSVAFIARRALSAVKDAPPVPPGERVALALTTDDDDPADTGAKLKALAGARSLDDALAAAWTATRERFQAWIAREEAAEAGARADDLDAGLRDAAAAGTTGERLTALAASEYPRVRALVAAHATTPAATLTALAKDRERTVRKAVKENANTPAPLRAAIDA